VIVLSDGYLANGAEPWRLPEVTALPEIPVEFRQDPEGFKPYARNAETLARPWAIPGTPGLEHRIGGLAKAEGTGAVSYDPQNHERMIHLRAEKVERVARELPPLVVDGPPSGKLLVLGWGSTQGALIGGVNMARRHGYEVSRAHLRWLNPLPSNLGEVLSRFDRVLLPEMNLGQLAMILRARFLKDVISYSKVQGRPFFRQQVFDKIVEVLGGVQNAAAPQEIAR
jgi:2-oxoglutarate ferredoxin oxidoreductase subunit alpha